MEALSSLWLREAPVGIEPTNGGFADLCLTTWLRRRMLWANNLARLSRQPQGRCGRFCGHYASTTLRSARTAWASRVATPTMLASTPGRIVICVGFRRVLGIAKSHCRRIGDLTALIREQGNTARRDIERGNDAPETVGDRGRPAEPLRTCASSRAAAWAEKGTAGRQSPWLLPDGFPMLGQRVGQLLPHRRQAGMGLRIESQCVPEPGDEIAFLGEGGLDLCQYLRPHLYFYYICFCFDSGPLNAVGLPRACRRS